MKISLSQNMGIADRIGRVCIGIALVIFGVFIVTGAIGIFLIVLGIPLLLSAIVGFCPPYVPFGISTKRGRTCC
jgi:hypothetical protein